MKNLLFIILSIVAYFGATLVGAASLKGHYAAPPHYHVRYAGAAPVIYQVVVPAYGYKGVGIYSAGPGKGSYVASYTGGSPGAGGFVGGHAGGYKGTSGYTTGHSGTFTGPGGFVGGFAGGSSSSFAG